MGYSEECKDLKTYWNSSISKCVPCPVKPGFEITSNCGKDDDGGIHEVSMKACKAGTFNDGSGTHCQSCAPCPAGHTTIIPCSTTADTQCQDPRKATEASTTVPTTTTITTTSQHALFSMAPEGRVATGVSDPVLWAVPLAILIIIILVVIAACVLYIKRKRVFRTGHQAVLGYSRRSSYINSGFSSLSSGNNDLEDILSPSILSAPLQTVLDNLDVLEELVILLDPESQGVKNTKHLASHFSFPATWITYTYSMKESKSPLTAVLEGVSSRQPDSTVGHLAKLLQQIKRNDAIAVLAKLKLNVIQQV